MLGVLNAQREFKCTHSKCTGNDIFSFDHNCVKTIFCQCSHALSLYMVKTCVIFHTTHRNLKGTTGTNNDCLTQNLLKHLPLHVLPLRIAVRVGTINFSLVESVRHLVFLSFTDLSIIGADVATIITLFHLIFT